jgi:hypothetical protein
MIGKAEGSKAVTSHTSSLIPLHGGTGSSISIASCSVEIATRLRLAATGLAADGLLTVSSKELV